MPELPDVENYRRYLEATALRKTIAGVTLGSARVLRGLSGRKLDAALSGRRLESARRHGKQLLAALDEGGWLTLHFGMTGRLAWFRDTADAPRHDRLRLDFANGYHLAFVDQRLLGRVGLATDADAFIARAGLGPDALDPALDADAFAELLKGRRGGIKAALMDQGLIAGIGNVYSDEILFHARLHPATPVPALAPRQVSGLYRAMRRVLETAIDRGAGSEELTDRLPKSYLLPRRKPGARCPRCGGAVEAVKTGGRTGYLCPACQPPPGKG